MITYKEFEVIRAMLNCDECLDDIPLYVMEHMHYYVFKSQEEIKKLVISLEKKRYIAIISCFIIISYVCVTMYF